MSQLLLLPVGSYVQHRAAFLAVSVAYTGLRFGVASPKPNLLPFLASRVFWSRFVSSPSLLSSMQWITISYHVRPDKFWVVYKLSRHGKPDQLLLLCNENYN